MPPPVAGKRRFCVCASGLKRLGKATPSDNVHLEAAGEAVGDSGMRVSVAAFCAAILTASLAACGVEPAEGAAAPAVEAAQAEGAEAFVRELYSVYHDDPAVQSGQSGGVWSARTKDLWDENFEVADGVGYLGADPICSCQDWFQLRLTSVVVTSTGADRADAAVVFVNGGETTRQTLKLVREEGQWAVDDIAWGEGHIMAGEPNMVEGLIASTAELRAMPEENR